MQMDVRFNDRAPNTWQVSADVESVELDPHNEHLFAVSCSYCGGFLVKYFVKIMLNAKICRSYEL